MLQLLKFIQEFQESQMEFSLSVIAAKAALQTSVTNIIHKIEMCLNAIDI